MKIENLKDFLGVTADVSEKELCSEELILNKDKSDILEEEKTQIKKLFNLALENDLEFDDEFKMYFYSVYVDEPYDGYDFKDKKEEFFYNNGESFIVFEDKNGFKVKFKIRNLKNFKFKYVYKVVKRAIEYGEKHPGISNYRNYRK